MFRGSFRSHVRKILSTRGGYVKGFEDADVFRRKLPVKNVPSTGMEVLRNATVTNGTTPDPGITKRGHKSYEWLFWVIPIALCCGGICVVGFIFALPCVLCTRIC